MYRLKRIKVQKKLHILKLTESFSYLNMKARINMKARKEHINVRFKGHAKYEVDLDFKVAFHIYTLHLYTLRLVQNTDNMQNH